MGGIERSLFLTELSALTEARTFSAVGWKRRRVTLRSCPRRSAAAWVMVVVNPPSGIVLWIGGEVGGWVGGCTAAHPNPPALAQSKHSKPSPSTYPPTHPYLPKLDGTVFRGRGNDLVMKRVEIKVQHIGSMPPKHGRGDGKRSLFFVWDDGERPASSLLVDEVGG